MTLQDYWHDLKVHDWHYAMSDDPGVYHAGERDRQRLRHISTLSPAHKKLYDEFVQWGYHNAPIPPIPMSDIELNKKTIQIQLSLVTGRDNMDICEAIELVLCRSALNNAEYLLSIDEVKVIKTVPYVREQINNSGTGGVS